MPRAATVSELCGLGQWLNPCWTSLPGASVSEEQFPASACPQLSRRVQGAGAGATHWADCSIASSFSFSLLPCTETEGKATLPSLPR